ncbi:HNH endonuclease [Mesorhizobium sp. KR9-304]|uniref:HNH endonuclease n=1 Tax=Mesorhizobium sp. KR9-304 TaxID=3156614 RepID=UPI0032B46E9D
MAGKLRMMVPAIRTMDTRTVKVAPKRADPFYLTPEWRALMDAIIVERFGSRAHARCEDRQCQYPHRRGIRVFGDHIIEIKDGGALLDRRNIKCVCGSCHTRKTAAARAARLAARP